MPETYLHNPQDNEITTGDITVEETAAAAGTLFNCFVLVRWSDGTILGMDNL